MESRSNFLVRKQGMPFSRHLGLGFRVRVRVRVRKHFFQGTQGGLGLITLGGKMSGEGGMTSYSLEVLLAAILKKGAGGINQNMLEY